jgi:acetyl-CoA carboxylase biotin carboxyl carrier protein
MDLHEIKTFIDAMATSDLTEMEVSRDGWTLRLVRRANRAGAARAAPAPATEASAKQSDATAIFVAKPAEPAGGEVRAPLAGIVYLRPTPGEPPFVVVGQPLEMGATVCVIEAMKVFNTVRAERAGIVESILVTSATEVEAGQLLMRIA